MDTSLVDGREPMALTYGGVARALGISERTVWAMVDDGRLRAVRIGRCVRVPRVEIEKYLAGAASEVAQ
ncbi:MAG: helix-turn-helix domain-containing protein [Pirellulales bacterium]|nr:helix-turn-helix domain-containing protein [Pirellulales bacterium]